MSLKLNISLTLPAVDNPIQVGDPTHRRNCRQLSDLLKKLSSGNLNTAGTSTIDLRTSGVCASAYLTASSASGSVGAVIGGTTVTATASGGDNASLALIKAAINADATVSKWVVASIAGVAAASEYVTLASTTTGLVTVTVNGIAVSVTHDTNVDTDGAALQAAINASRVANFATASYNASNDRLTITANAVGSAGNAITLAVSGTGAGSSSAHGATLAGGTDKVVVTSLIPGVIGNSISFVASGTGITASAARLAGGSESRVSYSL